MKTPPNFAAESDFRVLRQIGGGAFSAVFEVSRADGELQCLKVIRQNGEKGIPTDALREISMLTQLRAQSIVRLIEVSEDAANAQLLVFLERLETDLQKFIANAPPSLGALKSIFKSLLLSVEFVHSRGVVHRDVKPANVLLGDGGTTVKLADFGFAARLNLERAPADAALAGTLAYLAPEQLSRDVAYSYATDVWSLGCVLAELALGAPLFHAPNEEGVLRAQRAFLAALLQNGEANAECPRAFDTVRLRLGDDGLELLRQMLNPDSARRPNVDEALCHPFFHGLH